MYLLQNLRLLKRMYNIFLLSFKFLTVIVYIKGEEVQCGDMLYTDPKSFWSDAPIPTRPRVKPRGRRSLQVFHGSTWNRNNRACHALWPDNISCKSSRGAAGVSS